MNPAVFQINKTTTLKEGGGLQTQHYFSYIASVWGKQECKQIVNL